MELVRRYRLLLAVLVAALALSVMEAGGRVWEKNPFSDARDLPPEADTCVALWPENATAEYLRALEEMQLRFDLEAARKHLERALELQMPTEERILHQYAQLLVSIGADSAAIDEAVGLWRRHFPDSKEPDPLLAQHAEYPARQLAGSRWTSALAPHGRLLATLHRAGTIQIAEVMTGKETQFTDERPRRAEVPLGFSPDGTLLATADEDHAVTLWDIAEQQPRARLVGHAEAVYGIAFSADGGTCATGSRDRSIRFWDIASGKPLAVLADLRRPVSALAFSPDRVLLAAGNWNGEVNCWDIRGLWDKSLPQPLAHEPALSVPAHRGVVTVLTFAPDGTALVSASRDGSVRLWEGEGTERLVTEHEAAVTAAVFLSDGRVLATAGSDFQVQFWDLAAGEQLHAMRTEGRVFGLGYSAETRSLGIATLENNVPSVVHLQVP